MTEMILQATVIMLALLALRPLLKRYLSAGARCALWAIPAARLLFPFELRSVFSLMLPVRSVSEEIQSITDTSISISSSTWLGSGIGMPASGDAAIQNAAPAASAGISVGSLLLLLWLVGAAVTGGIIISQNIKFYSTLKRLASPVEMDCPLPVYMVSELPSPCLAGLLKPCIYINRQATVSDDVLKMTLHHELTHYRRGDHLWNALRGVLLSLFWFHPLVWYCAELFRRDCETACDEAATRNMTAADRESYGMALITLASPEKAAGAFVCLSTMGGSKKLLKERITQLASGKPVRYAAAITIGVALVLCLTLGTMPRIRAQNEDAPADVASNAAAVPLAPAAGQPDTVEDLAYHIELAALDKSFMDMEKAELEAILAEYGELLNGYKLIARASTDGSCAYIAGEFSGNIEDSPLCGLDCVYFSSGIQTLYAKGDADAGIEAMRYDIKNNDISYSKNSKLIIIEPAASQLSFGSCYSLYISSPNGRAYIEDAVSRGVALFSSPGDYLTVYLISEQYGEIAEKFMLNADEAAAILAEEKDALDEGIGFCASLHTSDGKTTYFSENSGVPRAVIDLAVERCGYKFANPDRITGDIISATLECSWLDEELHAKETDLNRLKKILKNAEFLYVGACGYGAKLTLELSSGECVTVFKGTDCCGSLVFGSYGGYEISESENAEFWNMFGLDPVSKEPVS